MSAVMKEQERKDKADFKARLLRSLRGGEYKQGRKALMDFDGCLCVMGVACEVAGIRRELFGGACTIAGLRMDFGDESEFITQFRWLQELEDLPVDGGDYLLSVVEMNDDGSSFEELADLIEEHWCPELNPPSTIRIPTSQSPRDDIITPGWSAVAELKRQHETRTEDEQRARHEMWMSLHAELNKPDVDWGRVLEIRSHLQATKIGTKK